MYVALHCDLWPSRFKPFWFQLAAYSGFGIRNEDRGKNDLNDLEARFAEVEKRVQALLRQNRALTKRIGELERDLAQARREALESEHFHGKSMHIRDKVERILSALEGIRNEG
jgi:septal ring factor EnvC (AmiA/AmiB activator)